MLIACWSAKGGSGTTVVAAALALSFARSPNGAVLADLAGDAACVLGLPEPEGPGLHDWLGAGDDVPADALSRLAVPAAPGLVLLPRGSATADAPAARMCSPRCSSPTRARSSPTAACSQPGAAQAVAAAASASLLVVRPCYRGAPARVGRAAAPEWGRVGERARPGARPSRCRGCARRSCARRDRRRARSRSRRRCRAALQPSPALARTGPPERGVTTVASSASDLESRVHRQLLVGAQAGESAPSARGDRRARPAGGAAHRRARARGRGPPHLSESRWPRARSMPLLADSDDHRGDGQRPAPACGSSARAGSSARHSCSTRRRSSHLIERVVSPLGLRVDRSSSARRRPAARWLAGERGRASARDRRPLPHHPPLRRPRARARGVLQPRRSRRCCARRCVARLNILVCGGTGSGKTTLLNSSVLLPRRGTSASSPSRTPPSCGFPVSTSCASRPGPPPPKEPAP